MTLEGKGFFIWQIPNCEGGIASAIADTAVAAGLKHVLIKIADGIYPYGFDVNGVDLVPPVAGALKARGLQVWGWHYVYGNFPTSEANIAVSRMTQLLLDGYVIDAEVEYEDPAKQTAAATFMSVVRAGLPTTLVALSSFRYPSIHPDVPWSTFLEKCDLNVPQVYWEQAHNPDVQLSRTIAEFADPDLVGYIRPVVPVGAAYGTGTWRSTPDDITLFLNTAVSLGLTGANFWSWDYARSAGNTDLWDAVAQFPWPGPGPLDIVVRFIAALNSHDSSQVLALYKSTAGHITFTRTVVGLEDISKWYLDLFGTTLPGAIYTLLSNTGSGSLRTFTWTASTPEGASADGSDTFGLKDGLIQYHYTAVTVTPLD
jgi:hypothetical protein